MISNTSKTSSPMEMDSLVEVPPLPAAASGNGCVLVSVAARDSYTNSGYMPRRRRRRRK